MWNSEPITAPTQAGSSRHDRFAHFFALLLFALLALRLTGPGLFARGSVCAGENADTWFHLWAFWKTRNALFGGDSGYLMSHMLSYPERFFDPISVVDPLLPLMSVPLQAASLPLATVFCLLVAGGLTFSAMAGYLLISRLAGSRIAGFFGGLVVGFNPFIHRQVTGGFIEYAWWGGVPLTLWLYLRAQRERNRRVLLLYATSLLALMLMSFYCLAMYLGFFATDVVLRVVRSLHGRRSPLGSLGGPVAVTLLVVVSVVAVWAVILHNTGGPVSFGRPFPVKTLVRDQTAGHDGTDGSLPSRPGMLEMSPPDRAPSPQQTPQAYRTLHGSLDISYFVRWSRQEAIGQFENNGDTNPLRRRFDSAFGLELAVVFGLCVLAVASDRQRPANLRWLALAALFTLVGLGPFPIWDRHVLLAFRLPYAYLYRWLPGFSLIVIPGRMFLGALLCFAVVSARGLAVLLEREAINMSLRRRGAVGAALVAAVLVSFVALGFGGTTLPVTRLRALPVYEWLARQTGRSALLELPLRGDLVARMYGQSIHGRPMFRGFAMADQPPPVPADLDVLVRMLVQGVDAGVGRGEIDRGLAWLARQRFGYLVLHAAAYESRETYAEACRIAASLLGPAGFADDSAKAWSLTEKKP